MLTFLEKSNTNLSSAIISGVAGVAMAQEIVENYLLGFFNATYPTKTPSGISPVDMSTFLLKVREITGQKKGGAVVFLLKYCKQIIRFPC